MLLQIGATNFSPDWDNEHFLQFGAVTNCFKHWSNLSHEDIISKQYQAD